MGTPRPLGHAGTSARNPAQGSSFESRTARGAKRRDAGKISKSAILTNESVWWREYKFFRRRTEKKN
jgi:hypothetical protein